MRQLLDIKTLNVKQGAKFTAETTNKQKYNSLLQSKLAAIVQQI